MAWNRQTNIKGPQGPTGATGSQGIPGSQGPQGVQGPQGPNGQTPQTDWTQWDPATPWPAPGYGGWLYFVSSPWWATTGPYSYIYLTQRQTDGTAHKLGIYQIQQIDFANNRLYLFNDGYGFSGTYTPVTS